ncbi:MAG: hypothetical protein KO206_09650 [Methanomicrobiaceae archaeon]|uniref:Uncharacterized protein n=1 Tax=hydrocarbon metagenome TaxID=938273 RepID=A0A0W8FGC9_9ZZZZ|nr:hypothetical protein [Methanomicrobiaceae archaeon]MDD5418795.1 hypothetical protein [Methanomicrobiaceae archaeon]
MNKKKRGLLAALVLMAFVVVALFVLSGDTLEDEIDTEFRPATNSDGSFVPPHDGGPGSEDVNDTDRKPGSNIPIIHAFKSVGGFLPKGGAGGAVGNPGVGNSASGNPSAPGSSDNNIPERVEESEITVPEFPTPALSAGLLIGFACVASAVRRKRQA